MEMMPSQTPGYYDARPATIECVIEAATRQGVPANLLLAIASIEGGKNGQLVRNTNGTYDISHFQINSATFKSELSGLGIKFEDLAWRGCINAEVAAYLLSKRLQETAPGQSYWVRVANYHSRTPKYNTIYKNKLMPLARRWAEWLQYSYDVRVSQQP